MTRNFRTEIKLKNDFYPEVSHSNRLFLIGSCFSNQIGEKFLQHKFKAVINPLGISYNPVSISNHVRRFVEKDLIQQNDLISKGDLFNSYDVHGSFDNLNKDELMKEVNSKIDDAHNFLKNATHIYITLGTSWVYKLKDSGKVVNNCHKKPASLFTKQLLSFEEVKSALKQIKGSITNLNPKANLIFTVSPVRHLKDGFENNMLSKSTLRLAINEILDNRTFYFPAYEIVMDDLRDYRFYSDDMLHPNSQAVDYIWEVLKKCQMTDTTIGLLEQINKLMSQFNHRTFVANSLASKEAKTALIAKLISLQKEVDQLSFESEIEELEKKLPSE